jgi:DNA-binding transcriptional MerR regulator
MESVLPPIPAKRYFTIGEVGDLCGVKPHVLRYWEQEFTQLRPVKRRGNRRYYQHHEVLMIRRIRELLYDQGFTISGARTRLQELVQTERARARSAEPQLAGVDEIDADAAPISALDDTGVYDDNTLLPEQLREVERELKEIRELLTLSPWQHAQPL